MPAPDPVLSGKPLPASFYRRTDVVAVARDLLGKYLVTALDGQLTAGRIVETEAYRGPDDKACHAHLNRYTQRTRVMFEAGGVAYIYLCYGVHHLFNVVTAPQGMPHAVLIRAVEPVYNIAAMIKRRGMDRPGPQLSAGPGVMSMALGIRTDYTGHSLLGSESIIRIEEGQEVVLPDQVLSGPRIGVDYAEECAAWPWRFWIRDNPWVSRHRRTGRTGTPPNQTT